MLRTVYIGVFQPQTLLQTQRMERHQGDERAVVRTLYGAEIGNDMLHLFNRVGRCGLCGAPADADAPGGQGILDDDIILQRLLQNHVQHGFCLVLRFL
ncbi:MAG: hypothetical protein IKR36_07430, partial [Clostridia bacterium]|nr:hypothetical protein [Clostridia bacterium]